MTYPSDHHGDSLRAAPIEHDRKIVNGSILAIGAFAIVVIGIAWYAVTGHRPTGRASVNPPGIQHSQPGGTTGYGGAQPRPHAAPQKQPNP